MSRRERYSEETRSALLDAATELFLSQGFERTSLAGVATAADVTRGAIYHHFDDKRALFEAVMERFEQDAVAHVGRAAAEADSPWDAAMRSMEAFLDYTCNDDYGRIVWQQGPLALGFERWRECGEEYGLGLTRHLFKQLLDNGDIAPAPLELLTRMVFANIAECGLLLAETPAAEKRQVRDDCATLLRRILEGLRGRD